MNTSYKNWNFSIVLLGIISAINFQLRVLLIPLELFAVFYLFFSFKSLLNLEHHGLRRFLKLLLFLGLLLIFVQYFTDLYLDVPTIETAKSTASILTLVSLIFSGITLLSQDGQRLKSFLLGYILSSLLTYFAFSDEYVKTDSWKFLFANMSTVAILLALGYAQMPNIFRIVVIVALSLIHLAFGARSAALLTLLPVITLVLPRNVMAKKRGLVAIFLSILALSMLTEQFYQQLSLDGRLGISQQEKALQQFGSGPLLLFARSELLYEIGAIKENPWFGKGSNPILSESLLTNVSLKQESYGLQVKKTAAFRSYLESGSIPLHSMIFSSWVEAGLVGAMFWMIFLFFILRYIRVVAASNSALGLLTTYFLLSALWSLFFSPLGAGSRLFIALGVTCIAHVIIIEGRLKREL